MKNISRILFVLAVMLCGAGTAQAATDDLTIVNEVAATDATVAFYMSTSIPTASAPGSTATTVQHGQYLVLKVTPADGKWLYNEMLEVQVVGSPGGALAPPRRAPEVPEVKIAAKPLGLSTNAADGTGYYYYQIPSECTGANSYKRVVVTGSTVSKINLSSATVSGTTVTATTGGWTVNITFDALSFTYTGSVQGPEIESFSLTNGSKSYFIYGKHVSISGSGIEAGTYTATLTSQEHGCLTGTKTVDFEITQVAGYIKYNTTSVTKTYGDDAFTNSLSKFGDGTVKYSISPAGIATVDETTGEVTITGCGDATITATVTDGKNYTYATKTATYTLTVNPRDLSSATVSTTPDSYVYDGNPKTPGVTVVLGGKMLVKDTDYEVNFSNNTEAGSATVTVTGKGNYTGTALGSFTITSATGDLTFGDITKTYGNAPFEVSPSTVISPGAISYASSNTAVVTVSGNTLTIVGAGSATITATQAASGSYAEQSKTFTVTVNQAALTVTAKNHDITYGDAPANNGVDYDGFVGTEDASVLGGTLTYNYNYTQYGNVGDSYTITPGGLTSNNYTISFVSGTLKVGQREVGLNWSTPTTFTWDGNPHAPTASVSGLVGTDECTVSGYTIEATGSSSLTGGQAVNVGNYKATATGLSNANYKLPADASKAFTIGTASATLSIADVEKTYGDPAFTPSATTPSSGAITYSSGDESVITVSGSTLTIVGAGSALITASQAAAGSYAATSATFTVTVSKATLTVTADAKSKTYGDADPTLTYTATGFKSGDTQATVMSGALTRATGETVNDYAISQGTLSAGDNYTISFTGANLTVGQKSITIKANDQSITFGTSIATGTDQVTLSPSTLPGSDALSSITLTPSTAAMTTTGTITPSGAGIKNGGIDVTANYSISYAPGNLSITASASVLDTAPTSVSTTLTYNGSAQELVTAGTATNGTLQYRLEDGSYSADIPTGTAAGTYNIYYKVVGNTNYADVPEAGPITVTIAKAALTITAKTQSIIFGNSIAEGTDQVTLLPSTLPGSDALSSITLTPSGSDVTTTGTITPSGAMIKNGNGDNVTGNYSITYAPGNLTVNAKSISSATVSVSPASFVYDGSAKTPDVTVILEGKTLIKGTDYEITYENNTGTGTATVIVTGKGNYQGTANGTFTITTATGDLTFGDITKTYGDDAFEVNPSSVVSPGTITYESGNTAIVTVSGNVLTIVGAGEATITATQAASGSYTEETKTFKVTVNQKEVGLTWSPNPAVFTYDGSPHAPTAEATGTVNGDVIGVTVTGAQTAVGIGYIATATGLTGAKAGNYKLPAAKTITFDINEPPTIDRKHSGIEVRRNDTKALVDNEAYLTVMTDGKLRIDRVNIINPDPVNGIAAGVSIYIPASLKNVDDKTGDTYGLGSDIISTDANVLVTDVYMPETEEMLNVTAHAFRLDPTESKKAFIHVTLHLLDDYALCAGLAAEHAAGKVMTTVTPTTQLWTFTSAVDVVVPENLTANICSAKGLEAVAVTAIIQTTATVDGVSRILVKANNGVLMKGTANASYDLRAWPSEERPTGYTITEDDAKTYAGNELVPVINRKHFPPTDFYILYEDSFHELLPDDNTFVSACKAVLRRTSEAQARSLTIGDGTTAIRTLSVENDEFSSDSWYSLDGRKLDGKPTRKGLYVRNGQKVVIR